MFQLPVWTISPLLAALVTVGAYARLAEKSRVPGMQAMLSLLAAILFWSSCQFLEYLFTGLGPKVAFAQLRYVVVALIPVLWFLFAMSYVRRQMRLPRRLLNVVGIVPLATIALTTTNQWHHLMWDSARLVEIDGFVGLETTPGPWFYVHAVYSYALMTVATTLLAYSLYVSTGRIRNVGGVVLAPLVAGAANAFHLMPWNPVAWFDYTTLGFAVAAVILDRAVLRVGVFDNIPVLRDRVLEQLIEGVVVIRAGGQIIDINRAALGLLDTTRGKAVQRNLAAFLPNLHIERLVNGTSQSLEVVLQALSYDVTASKLDPSNPRSDLVLVFRDVTVRRDTEHALRAAQQELQRLAHTDPLTGLYNRRLFMDRLVEEVQRVHRHDGCVSVVLFDLDHFKRVNDNHGHDCGDRMLQAVATQALHVKRGSDVAARIGGEEFALLLPATDQQGALHVAQRLRCAIESIDACALVGQPLTITASVGVATVAGGGDAPGQLLKRADDALYRAKRGGRNQVCAGG